MMGSLCRQIIYTSILTATLSLCLRNFWDTLYFVLLAVHLSPNPQSLVIVLTYHVIQICSWFFSVPPGGFRDSPLKLGHDCSHPNYFQFIIHLSPFHSMLYSLRYWKKVQTVASSNLIVGHINYEVAVSNVPISAWLLRPCAAVWTLFSRHYAIRKTSVWPVFGLLGSAAVVYGVLVLQHSCRCSF
jgi:hypothetical protein